jgi:hypothetical protein
MNNFADFSLSVLLLAGVGNIFANITDVAAAPLAARPAAAGPAAAAATAATAAGASSCRLRLPTGDWHLPGSRPVRQILGKQPSDKYNSQHVQCTVGT